MATATEVISALRNGESHRLPGAFVSGSRAFGWETPKSDWDVCIRAKDMEQATKRLEALVKSFGDEDTKASGYNDGKKGETSFGEINLIPLHPLDMLCWFLATMEIRKMSRIYGIGSRLGSKEFKHGLFENLRGWYKTVIPYTGDTEDAMCMLRHAQIYHRKLAEKEDAIIDMLQPTPIPTPTFCD